MHPYIQEGMVRDRIATLHGENSTPRNPRRVTSRERIGRLLVHVGQRLSAP